MNALRVRRVAARGRLLFSLLAASLLGVAAEGWAQAPTLAAAEARFAGAYARYDRELSLFQQATYRTEQALREKAAADASRDAGRVEQALAAVQGRAMEEMAALPEVRRAAAELQEATRLLIAALEAREEEILGTLAGPLTAAGREALNAEWQRVRVRTLEVDRIGGGIEESLELRPVLDLPVDDRDTPADLREKAGLLEDQAETFEAFIATLDLEIVNRERRLQQERARSDALADIQRFDPDLVPGGRLGRAPPGSRPEAGAVDQTGVLAQLSPEEQLALFRGMRTRAEENYQLALERARAFRDLALSLERPG